MKKIYLFLLCAATVSFAALSCSKEVDDPTLKEEVQKVAEDQAKTGDSVIPEGMIRLSFGISHENDAQASAGVQKEGEETKTSWNGTTHSWSNGDQIRIIWGEGESDYVDAVVSDGKVTADVADVENYYAVYPTTATYTYTAAEGKISVSFGRNQSGSFADANIMAAKTSKAAASFSFKNMTSILKFSTGASSIYTKVTFAANDKTKLNGTVSTTFDDPFTVTNTPAGTNGDLLTIDGVVANSTYYAAVLPGITLSNGIGFKVDASNQDTGALSTASLAMGRSAVKNLGVIDNNIHKDWFIKEGGTVKGTSWEDAGGAERLVQLIYPTQSRGTGAGLTAAYRLHKATIHVAAGTYNIQAANGNEVLTPHYNTGALDFTIKGGYPTNLSGTATTGRDPENNATNFICNQATATDRVFLLSDANKIPNVTFDGITFPANGASLAPGTAFDFNSSAASNITFKKCYFTGFVQSSQVNGGPVYVQGDVDNKKGTHVISFTDCTFSGNTCNTGGAVYLYNANATVSFTDCTFSNNSSAANGGAIRARSFDSLTITGGTFASNSVTNGTNRGGAICLDKGTLTISGTEFTNNSSVGFGGALQVQATGTAIIYDSSFIGNSAATGSAVCAGSGSSKAFLLVFNSLFSENISASTANNGGAIGASQNGRLLVANSTIRATGGEGDGSAIMTPSSSDFPKMYFVSCTLAENGKDFNRNYNNVWFYNTIGTDDAVNTRSNITARSAYTIWGSKRYKAMGTLDDTVDGLAASCLKSFATDHYPLNSTASTSYSEGMSVAAIQALEFSDITLTDDQKALLAKDQKGNNRTGTIMGAYVLTE